MKYRSVIFALFVTVTMSACENGAGDPQNVGHSSGCVPVDYKNGVFYFPCSGAAFANSLSVFRADSRWTKIVAITSDNTGGHGASVGYFVTVTEQ